MLTLFIFYTLLISGLACAIMSEKRVVEMIIERIEGRVARAVGKELIVIHETLPNQVSKTLEAKSSRWHSWTVWLVRERFGKRDPVTDQ